MKHGYHGKILHIDLTTRTTRTEQPDEKFYRLYGGGGLLATYYLLRDTAPGLDPFDPANLLIFASSVMTGYPAIGLPRFTVCAKSPLTNGIGETRTEGPWGIALKASGYDALVIRGASSTPVALIIEHGEVQFFDAASLWGKTVGLTTDAIEAQFGEDVQVAAIGPAGENRVRFASIVSSRTHQVQRMGMGAVMGSKGLKAIALGSGALPPLAHPAVVEALTRAAADGIPTNPLSSWQKEPPGFAVWVHSIGQDYALDVENFRQSHFPPVTAYEPQHFMPYYRGISPCPGCPNDCIKILHADDPDLDPRASGIHQEITGAMGPNIGLTDIRALLRINNLCNQYGLDPNSLGFTLSMVMEAAEHGLVNGDTPRFGDTASILRALDDITFRRGLGDTLAEGVKRAAQKLGAESFALHVKGLEMVAFEPRSQTNLALGFATAPIGPRYDICEHDWDYDTRVGWEHTLHYSHTLGILERIPMEYLGLDKVKNYKALSILWSASDVLGICVFASAPTRQLSVEQMTMLLGAVTGWETSSYELMQLGERRIHLMRIYNAREGMTRADDTLPARFFDDPIPSGGKQGCRIDRDHFNEAIMLYYGMMGWDDRGVPTSATRYAFGLEWTLTP